MLRWMAPFLSFTAEEAWKVLGAEGSPSIFVETYSDVRAWADEALLARWQRIADVRAESNRKIEALRADGKLGSSLQAEVTVKRRTGDARASRCARRRPALRPHRLGGARSCRSPPPPTPTSSSSRRASTRGAEVRALLALPQRRRRDPAHPTICGRCTANLFGAGEPRAHA